MIMVWLRLLRFLKLASVIVFICFSPILSLSFVSVFDLKFMSECFALARVHCRVGAQSRCLVVSWPMSLWSRSAL
jgi:hypothetical protein